MNSMIVLSALLGLAVAVPQQTVIVDDGHSGLSGVGWSGYGLAPQVGWGGHAVSTSYASRVAHPSVHGGLIRTIASPSLLSHGSVIRSHSAPLVRTVVGPSILRSSVVSHGVPTVLSSHAPTVLSGHGIGLNGLGLVNNGLVGHGGYGLVNNGLVGHGW